MTISFKADSSGTFGEVLVNGSPALKVSNGLLELPDGKDFFNQGNIVGTVSQSGGIPTGAVVERGSNANGVYVRFADGTQICNINSMFRVDVTSATGNGFISTSQDFVLPATFVGSVHRTAFSPSFGGTWLCGESGGPAGSVRFRAMRFLSATNDFGVEILVVGRWF